MLLSFCCIVDMLVQAWSLTAGFTVFQFLFLFSKINSLSDLHVTFDNKLSFSEQLIEKFNSLQDFRNNQETFLYRYKETFILLYNMSFRICKYCLMSISKGDIEKMKKSYNSYKVNYKIINYLQLIS